MLSRWIRTWYGGILAPFLRAFGDLGITPNALTVGGLLAHVVAGALFALGHMGWGVGALLLGQLLDTFDGELARRSTAASPFGGFLDSICDHLGDFAVYMGRLWQALDLNAHAQILLIVAALFGSVFGSHVRSRAGIVGIDTRTIGVFTRFERTLVLVIGILAAQLTLALWVLAILNNFSALQRIVYAVRASRQSREPAAGSALLSQHGQRRR